MSDANEIKRTDLFQLIPLWISAGVGRTGTFIALDIMMQRIKKEGKINIFDLVKQLRNQRMKMVQTHEQYAFLYQAALELVNQPKGKNGNIFCPNRFNVLTWSVFLVIRNLQSTVLNYIHEFEIPEKWKLRRNRPNVGKTTEKLSEVETSMWFKVTYWQVLTYLPCKDHVIQFLVEMDVKLVEFFLKFLELSALWFFRNLNFKVLMMKSIN